MCNEPTDTMTYTSDVYVDVYVRRLGQRGLAVVLTEAHAPDLAIRPVSAPEGLERGQLAPAIAYDR